jgi:hypothetical protein
LLWEGVAATNWVERIRPRSFQVMLMKRIRRLSIGLLIAVATFAVGVSVTMLWVVPRLSTNVPRLSTEKSPADVNSSARSEITIPDGWQKLDFDRVVLMLPPDMKPAKILGDHARHITAYSNSEIHVTVIGDVPLPEWKEQLKQRKANSCDGPEILTKHPTYNESLIEIDGRPANLGIARGAEFEGIVARVCFPGADADLYDLLVAANCKDDRALQTARQIFSSIKFKR